MGLIVHRSIKKGDPRRLLHGFDYKGSLCGVSPDVLNMPYLYWPQPSKLKYPICMGHCPQTALETVPFPVERVEKIDVVGHKKVIQIVQEEVNVTTYPSHAIGGRFCVPVPDHTHAGLFKNFTSTMVAKNGKSPMAFISSLFQDLANGAILLFFATLLAIVLGYLYLMFLRHCAYILTWGLIWVCILSSAAFAYFCLKVVDKRMAEDLIGKYHENPEQVTKVLGYVFCGITGVLLILLFCLCQTISAIVGVIEASCDAIWSMQFLLLIPLLDIGLKILFTSLWMVAFLWVITSGKVSSPEADIDAAEIHGMVRSFDYSSEDQACIVYFIIGLVWIIEMITAVMHFVIGYSVANWYFTPCLANPRYGKRSMDSSLVRIGITAALLYHTGSLALSALIVALFRLCYWILAAIQRQARNQNNPCVETIASTFMCCVWCFEEIVCYVNKNAIIEIVLKSTDFFTAAGSAVKTLTGITVLFQVLGTITITCMSAIVTFLLAKHIPIFSSSESEYFVEQPMMIVACAAVIGFLVSCAYMVIFDMVSDTLLFCWLTDTEDGVTEFAPEPLRNIAGHPNRTNAGKGDF